MKWEQLLINTCDLMIAPSWAMLPYRTARLPSLVYAYSTARMQPFSASSWDSYLFAVENAWVVAHAAGSREEQVLRFLASLAAADIPQSSSHSSSESA